MGNKKPKKKKIEIKEIDRKTKIIEEKIEPVKKNTIEVDSGKITEFTEQKASAPVLSEINSAQENPETLEGVVGFKDDKKETSQQVTYETEVSESTKRLYQESQSADSRRLSAFHAPLSDTGTRIESSHFFQNQQGLLNPDLSQNSNDNDEYVVSGMSEQKTESRLPFESSTEFDKKVNFRKYEPH